MSRSTTRTKRNRRHSNHHARKKPLPDWVVVTPELRLGSKVRLDETQCPIGRPDTDDDEPGLWPLMTVVGFKPGRVRCRWPCEHTTAEAWFPAEWRNAAAGEPAARRPQAGSRTSPQHRRRAA